MSRKLVFLALAILCSCGPSKKTADNWAVFGEPMNITQGQLKDNISSASKGNIEAIRNLVVYYMDRGDTPSALKWARKGGRSGDCNSISLWAELAHQMKDRSDNDEIYKAAGKYHCEVFKYE